MKAVDLSSDRICLSVNGDNMQTVIAVCSVSVGQCLQTCLFQIITPSNPFHRETELIVLFSAGTDLHDTHDCNSEKASNHKAKEEIQHTQNLSFIV